jgi:hypothetical protein
VVTALREVDMGCGNGWGGPSSTRWALYDGKPFTVS